MSGIYIKGIEMPTEQTDVLIIAIQSDGSVFPVYIDEEGNPMIFQNEEMQNRAIPVPDHGQLLKVLKTERECVSRDCDRNCGKCDLSLEQSEILTVYDTLVSMFSDPADKEGER